MQIQHSPGLNHVTYVANRDNVKKKKLIDTVNEISKLMVNFKFITETPTYFYVEDTLEGLEGVRKKKCP